MYRDTVLNRFIVTFSLSVTLLYPLRSQAQEKIKTASASSDHNPGAVVEKITENSSAEKAGVQAGDLLLRWVRGDAKGEIASPFDVSQIEIEQAPRGTITLEGLRGTEKHTWVLTPGAWGLKTRPNLPSNLISLYQEGRDLAKTGKLTEAAERWRSAASQVDHSAPAWLHLWLLFHAANALAGGHQWKETNAAYEEVIAQAADAGPKIKGDLLQAWAEAFRQQRDWANAEKYFQQAAEENQKLSPESMLLAETFDGMGLSALQHGDLTGAEKYYSQAQAIQQKLAPGSLNLAKSLNNLGLLARRHGDLTHAKEYFDQALDIRTKLAPDSLDVADSLNNLGTVAWSHGDLAATGNYYQQSLAIRQKLAPGSLDVATSLSNLGTVAWKRGDLATAEEYFNQSLEIREKLNPGSLDVAASLTNLGSLTWRRGNLAKAEEYGLQAIAIQKKLAPSSLEVAVNLNNLGLVVENRGDLTKAQEYFDQALEIREKLAPGSLEVASVLNNLGDVAWERADLNKAEEYHRRALDIRQKLAPDSLDVATSLSNLGTVAWDRRDLAKAEEYGRQALAIKQKQAPDSLTLAETLTVLGGVARDRGDMAKAEEYYRQVLPIWEKLAPENKDYAETLAALARLMLRKQQIDAALPLFEKALTALEGQAAHLGGSEDVRSNFRAQYLGCYQDYIDLLIRQKQPEQAFQVLERSRARTMLEMLAEAHIDVHRGVDAALLERERSLAADLTAKFNGRIRLLSGPHSDEQAAAVNQEIEKLLAQQKDTREQIRASSPAYTSLTQPHSLSTKEVQQLLDGDTLLLAYSLGDERSYVFAVTQDSLAVYPLPKSTEIEEATRRAYEELSVNSPATGYESTVALSRTLLGAVAERLGKKRLVIIADGALQYVPFAALRTSQGAPLIAEHEIVNLPSASTLAVLRKETETRTRAPKQVAVLADPVFDSNDERLKPAAPNDLRKKDPAKNENSTVATGTQPAIVEDSTADLLTRSAADLGMTAKGTLYLPRLLSTRQEAKSILAVTQAGQALEALDFDASRATATSPTLAQYRIVHFATHGLVNSTHPELSGLVLSLVNLQGEPQNGFLDLQDIYNLNLPADLVVLSACETALGHRIQGEGLVGLTRAFMYAGAPRVVASLWRVPDRATAELMKQFYTAMLVESLPPAAALRKAQITLSKEKRWSAPYYWAGFTLQGEWK